MAIGLLPAPAGTTENITTGTTTTAAEAAQARTELHRLELAVSAQVALIVDLHRQSESLNERWRKARARLTDLQLERNRQSQLVERQRRNA